jgi:hypothetical protein
MAADSGPLLFARYAYGPNSLGYCGPDAADELFGAATSGASTRGGDQGLRRLAEQFEGAYPYLQLIAQGSGIGDPLDRRVVEAYWLGSPLLETVGPRALGDSLDVRFRRRLRDDGWRWLADKPAAGALPVHAFHVLDVFPRLGLMRADGKAERVLETIDACRIRWGTVLERAGDDLVVAAVPVGMVDGKLRLAEPRVERIHGWRDGAGFVDDVAVGDCVSIHWDWACEKLTPARLAALQRWTVRELTIANQTI